LRNQVSIRRLDKEGKQLILHSDGYICRSTSGLLGEEAFFSVVEDFFSYLRSHDSPILDELGVDFSDKQNIRQFIIFLRMLTLHPFDEVLELLPEARTYEGKQEALHQFVEALYDYWRSFERYLVCHSEHGPSSHDTRPYRVFTDTVENLTHLIRGTYRDICENLTGDHPRVYRQVPAGCQVGLIAVPKPWPIPGKPYDILEDIPFIRQIWIDPPLIIDPPMNKRTGQFRKVEENPLDGMEIEREKWLCFPAQVGPLVVFIYFHQYFIGLGSSLANLFELANDEQIAKGPDAVYTFGAPPESLERFGELPTVFYDDEQNHLMVAAVPKLDQFGYFGYIKKMVLTLHNIVMMKRGRMPFHGAMTRIGLRDGSSANVLIIGDTAAGKSETLEALRVLGEEYIRELRIIADDMGSIVVEDGKLKAYGTEIGAFIRLDDLQQGYAFGQIDRAIIMSPQKINARVVLPVTTLSEVLRGYEVDFLLYANNYEEVDEAHPILERFDKEETALSVFREGAAMAKGTTTSTGLVHSYFANIFGPPQYKDLHEKLALEVFNAAFQSGVFVGQLRTRLGIPGYETKGPEEGAKVLLEAIRERARR
jgi:hypothetical protein